MIWQDRLYELWKQNERSHSDDEYIPVTREGLAKAAKALAALDDGDYATNGLAIFGASEDSDVRFQRSRIKGDRGSLFLVYVSVRKPYRVVCVGSRGSETWAAEVDTEVELVAAVKHADALWPNYE